MVILAVRQPRKVCHGNISAEDLEGSKGLPDVETSIFFQEVLILGDEPRNTKAM